MHTITKKELVDRIADQTRQKRVAVKKVVQLFLDEVIEELGRGNRLEFRDFGVFETKKRAARIAQNPKTCPGDSGERFTPGPAVRRNFRLTITKDKICINQTPLVSVSAVFFFPSVEPLFAPIAINGIS